MKLLPNQMHQPHKTFFTDDGSPIKYAADDYLKKTPEEFKRHEKSRNLTTKSKSNMGYYSEVQEFKQNKMKEKVFKQLQQLDKLNSNMQLLMAPFSLNNQHLQNSPQFIKPKRKNHHSKTSHTGKRSHLRNESKEQSNNLKDKILENSPYNQTQNKTQIKRKSVSYRIHIPPKQFNLNQQSKRNIHRFPQNKQKNLLFVKIDNHSDLDQKNPTINKQKSSQSFIIRKKIISNVLENQKQQKSEKPSNRFAYVMQKYRKDRFAKQQNFNNLAQFSKNQLAQKYQTQLSPKNSSSPYDQEIKQFIRNGHKQLAKKAHNLKSGKSLKVRVNKLIKAQQNVSSQASLAESKGHQTSQKKNIKFSTESDQSAKQKKSSQQQIQLQILEKPIKIAESPYIEEEQFFQNFKEQNSIVIDQVDLKNEQPKINIVEVMRSQENVFQGQKIKTQENQSRLQRERSTGNGSNITNRKNRIASIRAIKNYYKKLETEEKSQLVHQQKQPKQFQTIKKKQKQPPCLTHKIKWGNASRKKLNSDRIFDVTTNPLSNFGNECSVDHKVESNKKRFAKIEEQIETKNTIEAQLSAPKTKKKPFIKLQFIEDQGQTAKIDELDEKASHLTPTGGKNLQKMFAQTLKSKEFIDVDFCYQRPGSKSLIIFQDPGISYIANNNDSIHMADTPLILPSFDRPSIVALETIQREMISPVAKMKKPKKSEGQEKPFGGIYPLQSLQELYFQLKSHNQIPDNIKQGEKIDSLEELFQK